MLKISGKQVSNVDVLKQIWLKEMQFYKQIARQKIAFAGCVLGESSRPRRMWLGDVKQWTIQDWYEEVKKKKIWASWRMDTWQRDGDDDWLSNKLLSTEQLIICMCLVNNL